MSSEKESASRWLMKQLRLAVPSYVVASLLTVVSAACFVVFSHYLSRFAARWVDHGDIVPGLLAISSLFLVGRYLFAYFASLANYRAANHIVSKIKRRIFPVLLGDSRLDSTSATMYVTRVSDDLKPFYASFLPSAIATGLVSAVLLVIIFITERWVGYILLVSLLVIPVQMAVIGIGAEALHKKHIQLFLKYSAVFHNRLQTISEIVNLDNFTRQFRFLKRKSTELNRATTAVMRVAILSSAILELFVTIAMAAIAIYLGMSLLGIMPGPHYGDGYDFGKALFLLTLSPYFFFYLRRFVSAYHDRNKALASAALLMPLCAQDETSTLERADSASHTARPEEPVSNPTLVSFHVEGLTYAYPGSPVEVLHNIRLALPLKGLVLVKGISGSGKSTLLKIFAGSLAISRGTVSVNGMDNDCSRCWLMDNSSYMNQFPFIFDGTLRYNLFFDEREVTAYPAFLDRILGARKEGWDTRLTHNGKQLSGGERQLVTLARMMLHPKPVAILDEPTSNLDGVTASVILSEIVQLSKQRLVIVASHERNFEEVADRIVNLNWGEQSQ